MKILTLENILLASLASLVFFIFVALTTLVSSTNVDKNIVIENSADTTLVK